MRLAEATAELPRRAVLIDHDCVPRTADGGCAVGAFIFLCVVLLLVCHFTRDTRRTSRRLNRRQQEERQAEDGRWRDWGQGPDWVRAPPVA